MNDCREQPGPHASNDFGFGLVDAMAAVRFAESWRPVSTSANETMVENAAFPFVKIPDLGTAQSTLTLDPGVRLDRVEINVEYAAARSAKNV